MQRFIHVDKIADSLHLSHHTHTMSCPVVVIRLGASLDELVENRVQVVQGSNPSQNFTMTFLGFILWLLNIFMDKMSESLPLNHSTKITTLLFNGHL